MSCAAHRVSYAFTEEQNEIESLPQGRDLAEVENARRHAELLLRHPDVDAPLADSRDVFRPLINQGDI
jgi:hypothetical protein